jgi:hypothetical protein
MFLLIDNLFGFAFLFGAVWLSKIRLIVLAVVYGVFVATNRFLKLFLLDYAVALFFPQISKLVVVIYGLKNRCIS